MDEEKTLEGLWHEKNLEVFLGEIGKLYGALLVQARYQHLIFQILQEQRPLTPEEIAQYTKDAVSDAADGARLAGEFLKGAYRD